MEIELGYHQDSILADIKYLVFGLLWLAASEQAQDHLS